MDSGSLDEINQQTVNSLRRLNDLWQYVDALPTWQQQQLKEALAEHYCTLQQMEVALEKIRWQNAELTAARQVVEAERQRYQELFEFAPDAYIVTDSEAVILEANQIAGKLLNDFPDLLLGKSLILFVTAESRQDFDNKLSQLQSGEKLKEWEAQIQPQKLPPFPVVFRVGVVQNTYGKVVGLRWLLQNITNRKQYEAELEMTQSRLEKQIEERTLELSQAAKQLKQEIAERQQAIATLRQQAEWEQLMAAMHTRIRQSLNLETILNTTVAEVRQFLLVDRVIIYQVDARGNGKVVAESINSACTSLLNITIGTPLFKERVALYRQGDTRVIHNVQQIGFTTAINEFLQQQQVKASLTVPILHGNQFWGLLAIHQCSGIRQWQQLEVKLLKQLATQVSIAIQQSELYRQLLQLNTNLEHQVQERTAQLQKSLDLEAMLKRISDDVRDTLDESQILQTAVWELAVVLNLEGCDTGLYDAEYSTSTISYEYTVGTASAQGNVVKMAEFRDGYRQLLQGLYFQFCELVPSFRGLAAILACPIFDNQGVLGDLWLYKRQEEGFNELEIRLVQHVANQCAIAIRQARLYQAAQAQIEELKKLNRLKDDFLNTVSHELRTPLANMKMAIQMLGQTLHQEQGFFTELNKPAAEQCKLARYFQILQNECEREFSLINDLLDLQKLSTGVHSLVLTSIQLQDWLPQIIEPFQEIAKVRKLCLQVDITPELPCLICDTAGLERVLSELLNNACKYTPPEEKIVVTVRSNAGKMHLSVSNSGVEVSAIDLSRIFEKFYRIRSHDFWKQGGTGLGLALVEQLVARLGGTIQVVSAAKQTCFMIELPLRIASEV